MKFYTVGDSKEVYVSLTDLMPENAKEVIVNTSDGAVEKHVPEIEVEGNAICVKVGSVAHPMLDAHFIKWILLENGADVLVKNLNPGEKPEARFEVSELKAGAKVYSFCNLHGLWAKEVL